MSVAEHSVGRADGTPDPARERVRGGGLDGAVAGLLGLVALAAGIAASVSPEVVPGAAGTVLVGAGVGLLLAVIWRDALATTLAAFTATALLYAVARAADVVERGAGAPTVAGLAVALLLALSAGCAFRYRVRRLGYVLGRVRPATVDAWCAFVEQKTVVLESHRRDGSAVPTAVSIAVDGDRAVVRTFEKSGKARRLRRDPDVRITPSSSRGTPRGRAVHGRARRLEGADARAAARLLRRKYPVLHGMLVPLAHRVGRARTGRTVHLEIVADVPARDGGDA